MGVTFRSRSVEQKPEISTVKAPEPVLSPVDTKTEVPYTDYELEHGHPYSVDFYQLGDTWDIFADEVNMVEAYLTEKIRNGDLANSRKAVEKEIRMMERTNGIKDDERTVVRLGVLSSYIKFMRESHDIKRFANY